MTLEETLARLESFDAGNDVLNGIELHPYQIVDVLKMLYSKRAIVRYDTGTGKTLLAAAAIKLLRREDPSRRFLMIIKKDQCLQTPKKLAAAMGCPVIASSAENAEVQRVFLSKEYLKYPVVLFTHACLNNRRVMKELYSTKGFFCGLIIDEAHELNNKGYAQSADIVAGLASRFEYCWALTATPIVTDPLQMAKLACIVSPEKFPNYPRLAKQMKIGAFKIEKYPLFFINRTAEDLGRFSQYVGHIVWVNAMAHQREEVGGNQLMSLCKGEGATRQAERLVELIKSMEGRRGLVYVRQHAIREWIIPFLEKAGIRYACINGRVVKERAEILDDFNVKKSVDVILTSVTTAVDADCDYVIFYEFTVELKQMIGRADRGLSGKVVDIFYILTRGSQEPQYFKTNVVDRSELVKQILGVRYQELDGVSQDLEAEVYD